MTGVQTCALPIYQGRRGPGQRAARRGEALPHETLLEKVWGPEYRGENHYLKVYIGRLRDKLEDDASEPRLIVNVRGVGYRLNTP